MFFAPHLVRPVSAYAVLRNPERLLFQQAQRRLAQARQASHWALNKLLEIPLPKPTFGQAFKEIKNLLIRAETAPAPDKAPESAAGEAEREASTAQKEDGAGGSGGEAGGDSLSQELQELLKLRYRWCMSSTDKRPEGGFLPYYLAGYFL